MSPATESKICRSASLQDLTPQGSRSHACWREWEVVHPTKAFIGKIYMGKEMQLYSKNPANKPKSLNPGARCLATLSYFAAFSEDFLKRIKLYPSR